jgi:hypothetical protein
VTDSQKWCVIVLFLAIGFLLLAELGYLGLAIFIAASLAVPLLTMCAVAVAKRLIDRDWGK